MSLLDQPEARGPRQTAVAIEQGRYSPSLEVAFRIARAFAVPITDVFQYQGDDLA